MKSHVQVKVILLLFFALHHSHCFQTPSNLVVSPEDVMDQTQMHEVAGMLNTTYLSMADLKIRTKYNAILWGFQKRLMVGMPARIHHPKCPTQISIIFTIDTASSITTLTKEAIEALFMNCPNLKPTFSDYFTVKIDGNTIDVRESKDHYQNQNILGTDFMTLTNAQVQINYQRPQSGTIELDVYRQAIKKI